MTLDQINKRCRILAIALLVVFFLGSTVIGVEGYYKRSNAMGADMYWESQDKALREYAPMRKKLHEAEAKIAKLELKIWHLEAQLNAKRDRQRVPHNIT